MDEIYLEYATAYVFYYNLILNMKESKGFTDDKLLSIKAQVESYT